VVLFSATVQITLFLGEMCKWDNTVLDPWSWFWKKLTCGYLSAVALYCLFGLITEINSNKQDRFIVIAEWNLVIFNLLWLFSFKSEWKKVYLTVNGLVTP